MKARILRAAIASVSAGALFAVLMAASSATGDLRLRACGADFPGNKVLASFEMAHGGEIWQHFPAMGLAPELSEASGTAFVVVFDGEYTASWLDDAGNPAVVMDVVCVVTADGTVNVYYDVSRTGFRLP